MINTQWLHTFITLVEVGHFTQTAEKLFMTQPGVSQHIKKLEQEVGTPLLQRIGKSFELTVAGEKLYRYGQRHRSEELALLRDLQTDAPFSGECRLACSGSLAMYLYPHLLKHQANYPEITIKLEAAPNRRIIDSIKANQIDLGIITQKDISPELEHQAVGIEPLCLVIPASMANKPINLKLLNQIGFINHPDGEHYVRQIIQANFDSSFLNIESLRISGYINQLNQILLPVAQGLGYTVLPQKAVASFSRQSDIHICPMEKAVSEELYLIRKKNRPLPKRYDHFVQLIQQKLK